jgi:RNA polymerase sigma factor (sigma-70 family)
VTDGVAAGPRPAEIGSFRDFFDATEARLRHALTAAFGPETGREAAADALAYGWEQWERVSRMANPSGYLYAVGRNAARRALRRRRPALMAVPEDRQPWIEPALPGALARLPERQRTVVTLVHGYGYSLAEAAALLGISKATAQTHCERGLRRLRRALGVDR